MLQALGLRGLLSADNQDLPPGGANLRGLARIDATRLDPRLTEAEIVLASDVDNPLLGHHRRRGRLRPAERRVPG